MKINTPNELWLFKMKHYKKYSQKRKPIFSTCHKVFKLKISSSDHIHHELHQHHIQLRHHCKSSSVEFNQYKNLVPANEDNIYAKNMISKRSWCCNIVKKLSSEVENEVTDLLEIILQTHLNRPLWSGQKSSMKVCYRSCSIMWTSKLFHSFYDTWRDY